VSHTKLAQSILKTIVYADIFDYPLTVEQLHRYLIGERGVAIQISETGVKKLVKAKILCQHPQTHQIALAGRSRLFKLNQGRRLHSEKKAKVGERIGQGIATLPGVQAVFLTGAVAMNNAAQNDDIDLMIITLDQNLWLTRLLITLSLDISGKRRKPQINTHRSPQVRDKICPNLYLDTSHLSVPRHRRNLYTAHEVVQARPLVAKDNLATHFLWSNRWVKTYLPNTVISQPTTPLATSSSPSTLNHLAYRLQNWYMSSKKTNELVTSHMAYFHPRNTSQLVLDKYNQKLRNLDITP